MLQISVIIPTYKDDKRLQACIDALARQSLDKGLYEVIVVNNSRNDIDIQAPEIELKILQELTPGSYAARNRGLEIAKGEFIAFTDSDCIPDKEWLEKGLKSLMSCSVDRVSGNIMVFPRCPRMTAVECYEAIFAFNQNDYVKRGSAVTANLFVRRRVFETIGLFNSSLFSGGDNEWNFRATQAGFGIRYDETAIVHHPARHSWRELSRKIERTTGGKFSINPAYKVNALRSVAPPIEAGRIIFKSGKSFRTKILAFFIAYRIKLKKLSYLRSLQQKKVHPQRS